jgi:hypothetical protein
MPGPEGVGVALAYPLTGHMSKGHDKGGAEYMPRYLVYRWRIRIRVVEVAE